MLDNMSSSRVLTRPEALQFVTECLEVEDVEEKLKSNRLQVLNEMIRKFQARIPFTNFSMLATKPSKRQVPTVDDIIESIIAQNGGVCNTLNVFFKMMLESLNYNVVFVRGKVYITQVEDSHVNLIVYDAEKKGDLHYVDVGIGFPTFQAIPLHLDQLPKDYKFAFHHVRFQKDNDVFVRLHKKTNMLNLGDMKAEKDEVFEGFLEFDLTPRDLSYFKTGMNALYTDEAVSMLLNTVVVTLYPPGKAITLRDLTVRVWTEDTGEIAITTFDTIEDAIPTITSTFPMITENVVREGFACWLEAGKRKEHNA